MMTHAHVSPEPVLARFHADAPYGDVANSMRRSGAAVIEALVDSAKIDAISAQLRAHLDSVGKDVQNDFYGRKTLRANAILAHSALAADLIAHDVVLGVTNEILLAHCENYRLGTSMLIEICPGESQQELHRDDAIYPMRFPGVEVQVNALWALTDFTPENGATRVLLGSHGGNVLLASGLAAPTVAVTMSKGSVLLYMGSLYHGGGANRSNLGRIALVNTYSLGWLRQEENHYIGSLGKAAAEYPEHIRNLMGFRPHGAFLGVSYN